uniref:rRNA adenine N(6)-methyltransferase n=1 Tax=Cacopsylla melanoneura TaxID=428564 RepID=A0A8D9AND8_9HEMI
MSIATAVRLPPMPSIRDIIKLYKLRALKQLSQNFLFEPRLTDKIVRNAGTITGNEVCEVGPGPGSITRSILKKGPSRLVLIEKDPRFTPCLEMLAQASKVPVSLHIGDVMSFTMQNMFSEDKRRSWEEGLPGIRIIGNLPFNVSTPLIIKWLHAISEKQSAWSYGRVPLTLTFQKEVAERMVAPEGSEQRSRLSVMCQNWCEVNHRFTISGKAFIPKPQVDVGVVHFTPRVTPIIDLPFKLVEKVISCVFRYRQKYVTKPASLLFPKDRPELVQHLIERAQIRPDLRPYQLSIYEFAQLCHVYDALCKEIPGLYDMKIEDSLETGIPQGDEEKKQAEERDDQIDFNKL